MPRVEHTGPKLDSRTTVQLLLPFDYPSVGKLDVEDAKSKAERNPAPADTVTRLKDSKPAFAAAPTPEALAGAMFLQAARERHCDRVRGVHVSFQPFRATLYSFRIRPDATAQVRFHTRFREANAEVFLQAAHLMLCRTRGARRNVERAAYDAFVQNIRPEDFELPGARRASPRARSGPGRVRSLDESFVRVNATYFEGQLSKPNLCWSPKRSRRILGTYQDRTDRLIASRIFDDLRVPIFVLDYLMYHELLHKHLGVGRKRDGRRCIHGPEFRKLERRYRHYREAIAFLKQL